ncbi:unnamed protein product [Allacma fusca]|uniref:Elongation of very long chain fatty acids protein n=1 Tax=Allacma fusca TaxID=39272 RepID=A0A8J2K8B2_9HEXA|nr:unnamed protein product [Allacma fusca]
MCDEFNISVVQIRSEYMHAYDFEVFDALAYRKFFETWRPLVYIIIGVYLLGIYYGQKWMEKRPAFRLNTALFLWNAALAIFSIAATIRGYPEAIYFLSKPNGSYLAVCSGDTTNYAMLFWGLLFVISKVVELGDTAFIILRKQKLIVLHWFHHILTLFGCWVAAEYAPAASRFYFVNTFVHSFMYTYYALKALKVQIPRRISMTITIIQILQMVVGVYFIGILLYTLKLGRPCRINIELLYYGAFLILSFLALFLNFFVRTYLQRSKDKVQ